MSQLWCISLWQPWASLWLANPRIKLDETRHWPLPPRLIGQRVVVHAAKRPPDADRDIYLEPVCARTFGSDWRLKLPRGAFLGTIMLTGYRRIEADDDSLNGSDTRENWICGNWEPGRFAWRGSDPVTFATPIPARGQQGWWRADLGDENSAGSGPLFDGAAS